MKTAACLVASGLASLSLLAAAPAFGTTDNGFAAFWKTFAAAAAKDDTATLSKLTVMGPGLDEDDKTFAAFHAKYLKAPVLKCLAKAKPEGAVDGLGQMEYSVFCGKLIYSFSKTPAGWRFTGLGPDD